MTTALDEILTFESARSDAGDDALGEIIAFDTPTRNPLDYVAEAIKSVPRGAASATIQGGMGIGRKIGDYLEGGVLDGDVLEFLRFQNEYMGGKAQEAIQGALPVTPGFENSWTRKVVEGASSMVPAVVAGVAGGPAGLAVFGGGQAYESTYKEVRDLGGTHEDAKKFASFSAGVTGLSESMLGAVPQTFKIFKRLDTVTGKWLGKQVLKSAGQEAVQEGIQEIPPEVARQAYIEDRKLIDSLAAIGESAVLGGTVGWLFGSVAVGIKAVYQRQQEKLAALADKPGGPSRRDYIEATGAAPKDVPNAETRKAEAGAAKEELAAGEEELSFAPEAERLANVRTIEQGEPNEVEQQTKEVREEASQKAQAQGRAEGEAVLGERDVLDKQSISSGEGRRAEETGDVSSAWQLTKEEWLNREWIERSKRLFPYTTLSPEGRAEFSKVSERAIRQFDKEWSPHHRDSVRQAIEEGKPVPSEVLADYPDLVANAQGEVSATPPPTPVEQIPVTPQEAEGETSENATRLANATANEERAARGQPPLETGEVFSDQQMIDHGNAVLGKNPTAGYELSKALSEKPRALDKADRGILLVHKGQVKNRYDSVLRELVAAQDSNDTDAVDRLTVESKDIESELDIIEQAGRLENKDVGAQGLQAKKVWLDLDDYSLATFALQDRADLGRDLTPDERKQSKELADALAENSRKQTEIDELKAQQEASKTVAAVETKVKRERSSRSVKARAEVDAAWADIESKFKGKLFSNPLDPELVAAGLRLAKAYIKLGVSNVADFAAAVKGKIGETKYEQNKDIWEEAWRVAVSENKPTATGRKLGNAAGLTRFAHALAEHFVETGVKDRDALIDAVHSELAKAVPGITRVETAAALVKYGQIVPLSKEETKVELRRMKGELRQVLKLNDMVKGRAPKATGVQYPTPEAEERRLIAQVNEAKKKGGYVVTDPERQLKTSLNAIETRLKNQIADLEAQIAKGERLVKDKTPPPTNAKIEALRAKADALREQLDAIAPKPELTDAQRLERYKEYTQKRIAELQEQLASGDVMPKPKKTFELDDETEALRFQREQLVLRREEMRKKNRFKSASKFKKTAIVAGELFDLQRIWQFGIDASFVGLHAGGFTLAHPIKSAKAVGQGVRAGWSKAEASRINDEILNGKNARMYRRMKLAITRADGKSTMQEETFIGHLVSRIPILANFARFSSTFLNFVRASWADSLAYGLSQDGKSLTDVEARAIGNAVNIATGRGDFGKFTPAITLLAKFYLTPRFMLSRFQLPFLPVLPGGGSFRTRVAVAKEMARVMVGLHAVYGLAYAGLKAFRPDDEDKGWKIHWPFATNPANRKWGLIEIDGDTINPMFGLQQAVVYASRAAALLFNSKRLNRKLDMQDPLRELTNYHRYRLGPAPGAVASRLLGRTVEGEKPTPYVLTRDAVTPLGPEQIYEALKKEDFPMNAIYSIMQWIGFPVRQKYEKRKAG